MTNSYSRLYTQQEPECDPEKYGEYAKDDADRGRSGTISSPTPISTTIVERRTMGYSLVGRQKRTWA